MYIAYIPGGRTVYAETLADLERLPNRKDTEVWYGPTRKLDEQICRVLEDLADEAVSLTAAQLSVRAILADTFGGR